MNNSSKETTHAPRENPEKDPDEWTTGDEPMTGAQRSYLTTLCQEAGEKFRREAHEGQGVEAH